MTITAVKAGTCAVAKETARCWSQVNERWSFPSPPKVASKYVLTTAPVPPVDVGSSAPESVELTLIRKALIRGVKSSNGAVFTSSATTASAATLKSSCSSALKPSARMTRLNARFCGADP